MCRLDSDEMEGLRGLISYYELEEVIGQGASGVVLRAIRREDRLPVAVKVVSKASLTPVTRRALAREVQVLKEAEGCENVVRFVEALEDSKFVYVVTELLEGGDLYQRLRRKKRGFEEVEVLETALQITAALKYLHVKGIAHRDLKLENIMFTTRDQDATVKIVDFGLCHWNKASGTHKGSGEYCGTLQYIAPEIAAKRNYVPEELDMWGLGIVMFALISKKLPFFSSSRAEVLHMIINDEVEFTDTIWENISQQTKDLIKLLLSKKGGARPSAKLVYDILANMLSGDSANQDIISEFIRKDQCVPNEEHGGVNIFDMFLDAFHLRGPTTHVATA